MSGVGSQSRQVIAWSNGEAVRRVDQLALEEPLEIRVDTRSVSVTMRTPGHDAELAAGFLVTEGLVRKRADVAEIKTYSRNEQGNVVDVYLGGKVRLDLAKLTRHVFVSSSCGLCGKASIEAVHQHFKPIKKRVSVRSSVLEKLPGQLGAAQKTFSKTGGLHAAAIYTTTGKLVAAREDVGRHNAVDKVIGYGFLEGLLPLDRHVLLVSGRASFEIMQKALAARIPIVAAISAPSSLAAGFAHSSGQTLIGFLRAARMNIYSHADRVRGV